MIAGSREGGIGCSAKKDDFLLLFAYHCQYDRCQSRIAGSLGCPMQEVQLHDQLPGHRPTGRALAT
jgi:hypothetical protein